MVRVILLALALLFVGCGPDLKADFVTEQGVSVITNDIIYVTEYKLNNAIDHYSKTMTYWLPTIEQEELDKMYKHTWIEYVAEPIEYGGEEVGGLAQGFYAKVVWGAPKNATFHELTHVMAGSVLTCWNHDCEHKLSEVWRAQNVAGITFDWTTGEVL